MFLISQDGVEDVQELAHGGDGAKKVSDSKLVIQDRDLALLRGLFESRVMTIQHAADM